MDVAPHALSEETPRTLPALFEGLDRHLSTEGDRRIEAIREHVRGIESFTNVTSPVPQHEGNAAMVRMQAHMALADERLAMLRISTSQRSYVKHL